MPSTLTLSTTTLLWLIQLLVVSDDQIDHLVAETNDLSCPSLPGMLLLVPYHFI